MGSSRRHLDLARPRRCRQRRLLARRRHPVVTLIGDEDDATSSGDPEAWREALTLAKGGDPNAIVFLGLVGSDGTASSPACIASDVDPAPRLHQLIQAFPFGSTGDICAPDYAPFFARAVSVIDTACDDFAPIIR